MLQRRTGTPRRGAATQRTIAGQQSRPVLTRALAVIEAIAGVKQPVALVDLARRVALPPATVYRLCQRLEEDGYIVREGGSRRYAPGARLMRLGIAIMRAGGASSVRHDVLKALVERIGETCNLTMLAGSDVLYLDRVETRWPLRLSLEPGSRVPLHCTASGKLFLAFLPKPARNTLLDALPMPAHTPRSLTDRLSLERDLNRIARRGYSTDDEEFLAGLIAVAVPVTDSSGTVIAAVACHAPVARLNLKSAVAAVPLLTAAAAKISATFVE
ncbi:MAG: IclR family transcriptional regulator [Hyphomicrobium sp.]|nr:MAG: IclR family transcriptional regulator [Hyphomicrobium sp.]